MKIYRFIFLLAPIILGIFLSQATFAAPENVAPVYAAEKFYYSADNTIKGTVIYTWGTTTTKTERTFSQISCDANSCYYLDQSELIKSSTPDETTKQYFNTGYSYRLTVPISEKNSTPKGILKIYYFENQVDDYSKAAKFTLTSIPIYTNKTTAEAGKPTPYTGSTGSSSGTGASSPSTGTTAKPSMEYPTTEPWKINTMFNTMFSSTPCPTYQCWISKVWAWAMVIMVPLSVLVLAAAGVVWMTSEGNPDRISLAKKLILGVVSGVGLILVANVLFFSIIGLNETNIWNVN